VSDHCNEIGLASQSSWAAVQTDPVFWLPEIVVTLPAAAHTGVDVGATELVRKHIHPPFCPPENLITPFAVRVFGLATIVIADGADETNLFTETLVAETVSLEDVQ
jgi:hypothetical protein